MKKANKSITSHFQQVISLFSGEASQIWAIFVYAAATGLLLLSVPIAVQSLVNTIALGGLRQPLVVLSAILLVVLIFAAILSLLQVYIAEKLQRRLAVRIALTLSHLIPKSKFDHISKTLGPEYVNRFIEVFSVQKIAAELLLDGSLVLFRVLFGLVLMALYHPVMLVFSIILLIAFLLVFYVIGRRGVETAIDESTAKYGVLAWLEDLAAAPVTFKAQNAGIFALDKTDNVLVDYLHNRSRHFKIIFTQQVVILFIQAIVFSMLLALGGHLVMKNELTIGQLVAAELVLGYILTGMAKLTKHAQNYYTLCAGVDKLNFLVESPVEESRENWEEKLSGPASIQINEACIASSQHKIIKTGIINIPAAGDVIIYGTNSSGKSSIVDALYGFNKLKSGAILIDGRRIDDLPLEQLRSEVQLIRGIEIFHGTIEENIRVGNNASQTELRSILDLLDISSGINQLPDGLNTYLRGQRGPLSTGIALRMMIARALVSKPRLVIIDEILDGIDATERIELFNKLKCAKLSWTLIVTTHDSSFLQAATQRLQVKDQKLISWDEQ